MKRRVPEMCTFGVLGLSCASPGGPTTHNTHTTLHTTTPMLFFPEFCLSFYPACLFFFLSRLSFFILSRMFFFVPFVFFCPDDLLFFFSRCVFFVPLLERDVTTLATEVHVGFRGVSPDP